MSELGVLQPGCKPFTHYNIFFALWIFFFFLIEPNEHREPYESMSKSYGNHKVLVVRMKMNEKMNDKRAIKKYF